MISPLCYMVYFYDWENGKYPPIEMKIIKRKNKPKISDYNIKLIDEINNVKLITKYFA